MTLDELNAFTKAYIIAALWTYDEHAPSGEYTDSGRVEELFPKISPDTLKRMIGDCSKFQQDNRVDLEVFSMDESQNGHDFLLTRNRHGAGFWDRPQMNMPAFTDVGNRLTEAAHEFGESSLYEGDDGLLYN